MFFFSVGRIFGLPIFVLYYCSVYRSFSNIARFVLAQQYHRDLGGKPVTVEEVVFQEVETVLTVKIVGDTANKRLGYNGTYVRDKITVCVITLFVSPLEADI